MNPISKSVEITDAHIQFVSLVDKAANKKRFLITKQEDGSASFTNFGRIVKVDDEAHYVTGVVYEPMAADAHDNFMTEPEIEKAAHWYLKHAGKVDVQHSFEPAEGLSVVESWVTKSDTTIGSDTVRKGTWMMTVEVEDEDIWKSIRSGDITGLSMGGTGRYAAEDTDLSKSEEPVAEAEPAEPEKAEKRGLLKRLAHFLGMDMVEKGEVQERYAARTCAENFYTAVDALHHALYPIERADSCAPLPNPDEAAVREALSDFNNIIVDLLGMPEEAGVAAALQKAGTDAGDAEVAKAGRKMSKANRDRLKGICNSLMEFLKDFDDPDDDPDDRRDDRRGRPDPDDRDDRDDDDRPAPPASPNPAPAQAPNPNDPRKKEETDMTKEDVQKMIEEEVAKAVHPAEEAAPQAQEPEVVKEEFPTAEQLQAMIQEAVTKAYAELSAKQDEAEPVEKSEEEIDAKLNALIDEAVSREVTKALQARGVPTSSDTEPVAKEEQHYLHGLL